MCRDVKFYDPKNNKSYACDDWIMNNNNIHLNDYKQIDVTLNSNDSKMVIYNMYIIILYKCFRS